MTSALVAAVIDLLVGLVISVGIGASYLPQHVSCWKQKSAKGLSLWTVLISTVSASCMVLASLLSDYESIQAAAVNQDVRLPLRILRSLNAAMPTFQNLVCVGLGIPTYAIYYFWFAPTISREQDEVSLTSEESPRDRPKHRVDVVATAMTWMLVALALAVSVWALLTTPESSLTTAADSDIVVVLMKFWGGTAAFTNVVQWIPQIDTTWRAQHEGVLSLVALTSAVVGDFLLGAFWIISKGETVWVYGTLAADAAMQTVLLGMILQFRRRRRLYAVEETDMLETPLLSPDDDVQRVAMDIKVVVDPNVEATQPASSEPVP